MPAQSPRTSAPKPPWLKVRLPGGERHAQLRQNFRRLSLHTVCEEARCPNVGECWREGTATIMVLGDVCTRGCRFCAVRSGNPGGLVDAAEPRRVGEALAQMDLAYVVLTMVDRDDLADGGADHMAQTVRAIRAGGSETLVETLVGDFGGKREPLEHLVMHGKPDVFAHNVEVVPGLQRAMRDARCSFERSLQVLRWARQAGAQLTKSSLMVGAGEDDAEVIEAMHALREADVDVVTVGQYLRPSPKHAEVQRYVEPAQFEAFREAGLQMGFRYVASGPLVRSSYRAAEAFMRGTLSRGATSRGAKRERPAPSFDRYGKRGLEVIP
ncbi:MAG: lipoyl synthase [Myxococcales bacterium]|nr:lipoyl synthase [Myxococcales bacterium]